VFFLHRGPTSTRNPLVCFLLCVVVSCSVLQCLVLCVAVCLLQPFVCLLLRACSIVAVCCIMLQYVTVCCSVLQRSMSQYVVLCCNVCCSVCCRVCYRVCCSVRYSVCCSVQQSAAECSRVLSCTTVCCSVLQREQGLVLYRWSPIQPLPRILTHCSRPAMLQHPHSAL